MLIHICLGDLIVAGPFLSDSAESLMAFRIILIMERGFSSFLTSLFLLSLHGGPLMTYHLPHPLAKERAFLLQVSLIIIFFGELQLDDNVRVWVCLEDCFHGPGRFPCSPGYFDSLVPELASCKVLGPSLANLLEV